MSGSFHFAVMKESHFSRKNPRNISRARVRSDTASLERASSYRQICFAGFCVRMNQQHFLFSAHHHKDRGNGSKVNGGHLIRVALLAAECYTGRNQTIKVKLHQISNPNS